MVDGIAEHEGRKTKLANAICFYDLAFVYCFFFIYFCLTL